MKTMTAFSTLLKATDLAVVPCASLSTRLSGLSHQIHTYSISPNVDLHSKEKYQKGFNKYKLEGTNLSERKLAVLFPWMRSKDKNIRKYADIYLSQGFDVVTCKVPAYDLFRPVKGSQVSIGHLLNFLQENHWSSPIFIHAMSVGVYCFGELLYKMKNDALNNSDIQRRFVGQVYDSAVDIHGLPKAMGKVLASNPRIQNSIEMSLNLFLKTNYETATKHYENSAQQIYTNAAKVPALWIFSEKDIVSPPSMNFHVINQWRARNETVFVKCFEKSGHVLHFQQYRKEYLDEIGAFLQRIGLEHHDASDYSPTGVAMATA